MKFKGLWTRNYTLLMVATAVGCIGGIAGSYAMSVLVFDETGSTLATGVIAALQIIPHFLLPILIAPIMDRLPRKPILVVGDFTAGILYGFAGLFLKKYSFSYPLYLVFSLLINCITAFDSLAYNCIFPKTIPTGFEDKGYTVSAMLYPVIHVLVMPLAAIMMDAIGIANILLLQSGFSILAATTEYFIKIEENITASDISLTFKQWIVDFLEGFRYLKGEKGLLNIHIYGAVANGTNSGYSSILVAFFRSTDGFSAHMYAYFSAAEFIGRTIGGAFRYITNLKKEKRQVFVYIVQQIYNFMDGILLVLPYPLMLLNRVICGFLGINSATIRESSIQRYLPEKYRARVNSFSGALICAVGSISSLLIGLLGEVVDYRIAISIVAAVSMIVCQLTVWRGRKYIQAIYEA